MIGRFVEDIKPVHLDSTSGEKMNNRQDKDLTEQDLFTQPTPADGTTKAKQSLSHYHHLPEGQGSDWNVEIARQIKGTTLTRFLQYLAGLRIIHDYPILGIGPDTLGMIYPQYIAKLYREMNEYRVFENQNRIHNDLLNTTVSTGLLGLGVYLWFIFAYARMVWKGCKKTNRPRQDTHNWPLLRLPGLFYSKSVQFRTCTDNHTFLVPHCHVGYCISRCLFPA